MATAQEQGRLTGAATRTRWRQLAVALVVAVIATVVSWFVVSQLTIWFDRAGLVLSIPVVAAGATATWLWSRFGPAVVVGSLVGGLPTFVFFWLYL